MAPWSNVDPKLREWVEANRPALELFQQGADQADGTPPATTDVLHWPSWWQKQRDWWWNYRIVSPGGLLWLALLDGERRADSGDINGAWDRFRGVLRMTTHLRRRGSLTLRYFTNQLHMRSPSTLRPGQPIPGRRFRSSDAPWPRQSRPSRSQSGMRSHSSSNTARY